MKTYIIHATCRYVVKSKEDGRTESGANRPTISVEASNKRAAINRATKQQRARIGSDWWPVVSFSLVADVIRELS